MIKLREFDKEDWYSFAGCEAKTPLIGKVKFLADDKLGKREIEGVVVIDKDDISMYFDEFDMQADHEEYIFNLGVPMLTGKFIVENMAEAFDKEYLIKLGFICEGDLYK